MKRCFIVFMFLFCFVYRKTDACTRVVYKGPNQTVLTARSMDWRDEIPVNLWVFPKGMQRNGEVGPSSVKWTSRYGSVIASAWDMGTTDGMNEVGLVANVLWLAESQYPKFDPKGQKPGLSIAAWAQYVLDNYGTVAEAVEALKGEPFTLVSDYIPGTDRFTTLHLSLSDKSGDNAIFEYINGRLVIHHDPKYVVMTNSPVFDEQLALNNYWRGIPGTIMLPGTNRAADRFVRASFYIDAIPQTDDVRTSIASVFSVIRNCSVPYGISSKEEPNISTTRWRSVADHKDLVYYFETVTSPGTFWINLKDLDLSEKGKVLKLDVEQNKTYTGLSNGHLKKAEPFKFMGL
ncbi:linear amide C-N hydrolase [Sphingobacterium sp.]|uniref:linear amide C-N hydrolase n=1 Tax=Sphingobacterium sp. TaxID=341027 RepID=UPI002FDD61FF